MDILDLHKEFVKTIIRDTVETYSGQWRLVHEAIQNAHDSIQLNPNITEGSIEIRLFVASNMVRVTDNGTGIAIGKFNNIFQIGGTDKTAADLKKILKGSQGVGIKSTLFTSTLFKVETVYEDYAWSYELIDCYEFKEPTFSKEIDPPATKRSRSASGSIFTYSLNDYTIQDFINEIVQEYCQETKVEAVTHTIESMAELKTVLEVYFRTRTYLGCTRAMLGVTQELKPIVVKVILDFDSPEATDYKAIDKEYCPFFADKNLYGKSHSTSFPAKYLDIIEIHEQIPKGEKVDKIFTDFRSVLNNPPNLTSRKLLVEKFDQDLVKLLLSSTKKIQGGDIEFVPNPTRLKKHKAALEIINGMYLIVAQKSYMLRYFHIGTRQQVSVNGLPTNIDLKLPVGALAYLNNIHLVLDVNCTLGFGKRNLPGRTKGIIDAFYHDAWNMLRRVIPLVVGNKPDVDSASIAKWDKADEIEEYRNGSNKFRSSNLLFRTVPKEEQEVIALFFELLGGKRIKGYFPFRVGGRTIYDALFVIDPASGGTVPKNIKAANLKYVEFKYCISGLLRDLDDEIKFLSDIDLLICWTNDIQEETDTGFSIHTLAREGIDPYPCAQWRIKKGNASCQVLVLKDYLESVKLIEKA